MARREKRARRGPWFPLHEAILRDDDEEVERLLLEDGVDPEDAGFGTTRSETEPRPEDFASRGSAECPPFTWPSSEIMRDS